MFQATIYQKSGSFLVESHSIKVIGFRKTSLVGGQDAEKVRMELKSFTLRIEIIPRLNAV